MLPGLAVLAVMNQIKFGIASPFTYGQTAGHDSASDPATYLLMALAAFVPLAAVWVFSRDWGRAFVLSHRWAVGLGLALVGAIWLASSRYGEACASLFARALPPGLLLIQPTLAATSCMKSWKAPRSPRLSV